MRLVSLTCSNTEIVAALGCGHLLVGVDDHSAYPGELVSKLPRVGPDLTIDIEKVSALKPDLVLASLTVPGHEKVVAGLARAGLNYIAPEPVSLEDVYQNIRDIAIRLGVPGRGQALAREMEGMLLPSKNQTRPSLLVEWWPKPVIAPGKQSWVTDLMMRAGAVNPLGARACKSTPLSDDEVRDLNPHAIILSWCGVQPDKVRPDVIYRNEKWQDLKAIRERHVYCVPEAYLGRPGPRLVSGYQALKRIVAEVCEHQAER